MTGFENNCVCKFGVLVSFALASPSFGGGISHIVGVGSEEHMGHVHAKRHVTAMTNEKPVRYVPVGKHPGHAMRFCSFKEAVPSACLRTSPEPATIGLVYQRPKPLFDWLGQSDSLAWLAAKSAVALSCQGLSDEEVATADGTRSLDGCSVRATARVGAILCAGFHFTFEEPDGYSAASADNWRLPRQGTVAFATAILGPAFRHKTRLCRERLSAGQADSRELSAITRKVAVLGPSKLYSVRFGEKLVSTGGANALNAFAKFLETRFGTILPFSFAWRNTPAFPADCAVKIGFTRLTRHDLASRQVGLCRAA